jgi:hypothetical protein
MNENQWLTGIGTKWMLEHVRSQASPRKLRLFACASLRRIESLGAGAGLSAVQAAEAFADGRGSHADANQASSAAAALISQEARQSGENPTSIRSALEYMVANDPWDAAHAYVWVVSRHQGTPSAREAELAAQCDLLRCLFGNPFRAVQIQAGWLTDNDGAVSHLARAIEEEQRWQVLPILADALEEAGCTDATILDHLRGPGPHVCGCWIVDRLLQKQ